MFDHSIDAVPATKNEELNCETRGETAITSTRVLEVP
jgi:hypothetical protein